MDKQKLEEVRQLAMSMTSHPVAFGTIEHTEMAGELLGLLWQEVLRLQCDLKDAQADLKRLDWLMANSGLVFGRGWWALKVYAATAPGDPLDVLDWVDAAVLRDEDADARNEELAARWATDKEGLTHGKDTLRDCAQGVSLGADGMGWSPDSAMLEEAADKIVSLHAELQQARDGLTKGRTRMREDNERLREVVGRMVSGIDHLDKLAREWEPDHSSGADRRGWLLAKDARDDAVRVLGPNAKLTGDQRP